VLSRVPPSFTVDLNRSGHRTVETTDRFDTSGPFEVSLRNYGDSAHVHLRLDGDLAHVARIPNGNHFVPADEERAVPVDVQPVSEPVSGTLVVATGYGATERTVSVTVDPPQTEDRSVPVEQPRTDETADDATATLRRLVEDLEREGALPVVALGALTVVLAVVVGLYVGNAVALVGSLLVAVGVVAALVFVLR
jgi:hypothetical protein